MRPLLSRCVRRVALTTALGLVAFLAIGNATMYAAHAWASRVVRERAPVVAGTHNLRVVDDKVWRGAAPSRDALRALVDAGVTTVVDLRAEADLRDDRDYLAAMGARLVRIPIRDGQTPTEHELRRFRDTVRTSAGRVFVHCGAGVGRTGSMAAAYLVAEHEAGRGEALRRNLAVGPPSLEQVMYVTGLRTDDADQPNVAVRAVSRMLDAPRRIWSRISA
jgi:protein-tyrosine phosphatase